MSSLVVIFVRVVVITISNFLSQIWNRTVTYSATFFNRFLTQGEEDEVPARPKDDDLELVEFHAGGDSRRAVKEPVYFSEGYPSLPLLGRARFAHPDDADFFHGGAIAWTGVRRPHNERVIVLALDGDHAEATDGWFDGELLPDLARFPDARYLMLPASRVVPLPTLRLGDFCLVRRQAGSQSRCGGFVRGVNDLVKLHMADTEYKRRGGVRQELFPDVYLTRAPPPEGEQVSERVAAISGDELRAFAGLNKGIQGKRNSCYLDTLLFCFFAFSDDLNRLLFDDDAADDVLPTLNVLRHGVVFPLRTRQFVHHRHVEELRRLMAARTGNPRFLDETRDIPECMDALFGQLLCVPAFVQVGHFVNGCVHFNEAFAVEVFNTDNTLFPTSKQLLERSAVAMQFCLHQMTDCLLVQLARETGQRMGVFPSLRLDLKPLLYNTLKVCCHCKCRATLQFWEAAPDISNTFYCQDCAATRRLPPERGAELPEADPASVVDEETELSLAAVICIERSHYNCFVRCSAVDAWVFFDSMHDQDTLVNPETGQMETFNIPVVREVPNFRQWLEEAPRSFRKTGGLDSFVKSLANNREAMLAERLFQYPSLLIYKKE